MQLPWEVQCRDSDPEILMFIYLFLATLGLCFCARLSSFGTWASSHCGGFPCHGVWALGIEA